MRGSYWFRAKSKKVVFEFSIRRNITVIKGDSATGKTTLLHILYEYLRSGKQSGYSVSTNAAYYVYIRDEVGRDWKETLYPLKNTVIFIEENNEFVFTKEFAAFVKKSGNYFVLVSRAPLKMLPYSIHEIYEIITDGKRTDIKESYHEFKEVYSNYPILENNKVQNVVTEDSNSGYQFWTHAFKDSHVTSSKGNGNLIKRVKSLRSGDILVIADGAAFGPLIESCLSSFQTQTDCRISLWLPESFEYLILKSGVLKSERVMQILENTSEYVECEEYESWESFFTDLLITTAADGVGKYSKHTLNPYYLQEWVVKKIKEQLPEQIAAATEKTVSDIESLLEEQNQTEK